jgi:hypothetical protein
MYRNTTSLHYNEWLYVHDQLISESSLWSAKHSLKCQFCIDNQWEKKVLLGFILLHNHIRNSGVYNSQGCRIPIHSNLNIEFWRMKLVDYRDCRICDFLEFGWPVGHIGIPFESSYCRNQTFFSHWLSIQNWHFNECFADHNDDSEINWSCTYSHSL